MVRISPGDLHTPVTAWLGYGKQNDSDLPHQVSAGWSSNSQQTCLFGSNARSHSSELAVRIATFAAGTATTATTAVAASLRFMSHFCPRFHKPNAPTRQLGSWFTVRKNNRSIRMISVSRNQNLSITRTARGHCQNFCDHSKVIHSLISNSSVRAERSLISDSLSQCTNQMSLQ